MAADNDILGISGHLDISDIINTLNELQNEFGKIEEVSNKTAKDVERSMQEVGKATEKEIEGKATEALRVLTEAFDETKDKTQQRIDEILKQLRMFEDEAARVKSRTLSIDGHDFSFNIPKFLMTDEIREYYDEITAKISSLRQELEELSASKEKYQKLSEAGKEAAEIQEITKNTEILKESTENLYQRRSAVLGEIAQTEERLRAIQENPGLEKQGYDATQLKEQLHGANIELKAIDQELAKRPPSIPSASDKTQNNTLSSGKVQQTEDGVKKLTNSVNELKSGVGALKTTATGTFSGMSGGLTKLLQMGSRFGPWGAAIAAAIGVIAAAGVGLYKVMKTLSEASQKLKEAMLPLKAYVNDETMKSLREGLLGGSANTIGNLDRLNEGLAVTNQRLKENWEAANSLGEKYNAVKEAFIGFNDVLETSTEGIKLHAQTAEDMAKAATVWVRYYEGIRNSPKAIMALVEASNELATITGWTSEKAAHSMAKIAGAFHQNAFEARASVNLLVTAVKESTYTYDEFIGAMTSNATRAMQVGVSYGELAGAIKMSSKEYGSASMAASNFIMVMQRLNMQANKDFRPSQVGAAKALQNVSKAMEKGTDVSKFFMGRQRDMAMYFINNAQALDKFSESMYDAENKNKALMSAEQKMEYHTKQLENAWDDFKKELNLNVTPAIIKVVDAIAVSISMMGTFANKIGSIIGVMEPYLTKIANLTNSPYFSTFVGLATGNPINFLLTEGVRRTGNTMGGAYKKYTDNNRDRRNISDSFNATVGMALLNSAEKDKEKVIANVANEFKKNILKNKGSLGGTEYLQLVGTLAEEAITQLNAEITNNNTRSYTPHDKNTEREAKQRNKREARLIRNEWELEEKLSAARRKAQEAGEDAYLAGISDAYIRERETRKIQNERTKRDLEQQTQDLYKTIYEHRKKEYEASHKDGIYELTPEGRKGWMKGITPANDNERALMEASIAEIEAKRLQMIQETAQQTRENERSLIESHQSYIDKKLAIDRQYYKEIAEINRAIKEAEERGDMATVEALQRTKAQASKDRAKAQSDLSLEQLKETPEYIRAFEDLGNTSTETLQELIKQFEQAMAKSAEDLQPTELKAYLDIIQQMKDEINDRDPFEALAESSEKLRQARERVRKAEEDLMRIKKGEVVLDEVTVNENGELVYKILTLEQAQKKLNKAKDEEGKAENNAAKARKKALEDVDKLADSFRELGNAIGGIGGEILGMMADITNFVTGSIEAITALSATGTAALTTIEKASTILAVISTAIQLINKVSNLFGSSNRDEVERENKKLAAAITANTEAVKRLTDAMEKATPDKAYALYEQAVAALKSSEQAQRLTMYGNAGMHDGGHSLNYDFGWGQRVNYKGQDMSVIAAIYRELGISPSDQYDIRGLLRDLTAADWNRLQETEIGRTLFSILGQSIAGAEDDGNYNGLFKDIIDFANDYSEEKYKELADKFNEAVTHVSFDTMYDNFVSALMDMDKSAADFANDFEGYLRNALYQSLAAQYIQPLLEKWFKGFSLAMQSRQGDEYLSPQEINELMHTGGRYKNEDGTWDSYEGIDAIIAEGNRIRSIIEQLGLGKGSSQQSATANAIQNISYDQANAIEGILLGHTIILEKQLTLMEGQNGCQQRIVEIQEKMDGNIATISADIHLIQQTQDSMNGHLANISIFTSVLPSMRDELYKLRRIVEEQ